MTTTTANRTRIGLQIPNFTYPGVDESTLFETISRIAVTAEASGFDTVFVMDHFFQLPLLGPPENEMFEPYTLLSALAARTERVRLGTLVTGVTYRNPAILAKTVTALDVISKGRALLGIGAAWYELEHDALDVRFPPVAERFERLEDALRICTAMFREKQSTVEGTHHSIRDAWNVPRPVQPGGPPIMIGGQGEKKTLKFAAKYADELNTTANFVDIPHKLDVLAQHLETFGRARDTITVTPLGTLVIAETHDAAEAKLADLLRSRGLGDPSSVMDDSVVRERILPRMVVGGPDEVAERCAKLLASGLDGLVFNMPGDGHDPEMIELAGATLQRAFG